MEPRKRVGAILKADENKVHLLGYGTYDFSGNKMEIIETTTARIWLRQDGIAQVNVKYGVKISPQAGNELMKAVQDVIPGKCPLIVDAAQLHSITMEAKVVLFKARNIKALAIVAPTWVARTTAENLLKSNRPLCPAKVFKYEKEAVKWLKQYR
jgi:hypothetical protein